jgi:phosphate starvation-inducible PhoH-like protein
LSDNDNLEVTLESTPYIPEIFGTQDSNLKLIEKNFQVNITARDNAIKLSGPSSSVSKVERLFHQLFELMDSGHSVFNGDIKHAIRLFSEDENTDLKAILSERIILPGRQTQIIPKGKNQKNFIRCIKDSNITIAVGPAGTGKTYLAVALAVEGILTKKFKRIVLTRPAVEAGESLGYLPGDITEKINPYLMPLFDALYNMLDPQRVQTMIQENIIEIAPLAYMRGRTLSDSFIILDEAQNSTQEQMKMFLTRLGANSKMVATGDITQIDLSNLKKSGLVEANSILRNIEGISIVNFDHTDVVRHPIVQKIIQAYEKKKSKE